MEDSLDKLFSNRILHLTVPDNDIVVVTMVAEAVNIDYHNDRLQIVGVLHQVVDRMTVGLFARVLGPFRIDRVDMIFGHFVVGHRYIDDQISVGHH